MKRLVSVRNVLSGRRLQAVGPAITVAILQRRNARGPEFPNRDRVGGEAPVPRLPGESDKSEVVLVGVGNRRRAINSVPGSNRGLCHDMLCEYQYPRHHQRRQSHNESPEFSKAFLTQLSSRYVTTNEVPKESLATPLAYVAFKTSLESSFY